MRGPGSFKMSRLSIYITTFYLLLTTTLSGRPYLKIQSIDTSHYPYVTTEVSVTNIVPVENLDQSNFEIFENGWKAGFYRIKKTDPENEPKKITLLLDASKSLSELSFETQIEAARILIKSLYPNDTVSILSFQDAVHVHCSYTNSREQLMACLDGIKQGGTRTHLYDAIRKGLILNHTEKTNRDSLIIFSDGREEGSDVSLISLIELNKVYQTPVFFVAVGKKGDLQNLARISHTSGGEIYYSADIKNLSHIYQLLTTILDNTYQIEYFSQAYSTRNKNEMTTIEVRLDHGDLKDQDIYSFVLKKRTITDFIRALQYDSSYLMYGGGLLLLLFFLILTAYTIGRRRSGKERPGKGDDPQSMVITEHALKQYTSHEAETSGPHSPAEPSREAPGQQTKTDPVNYRAYLVQKEGPETGNTYRIKWNVTTAGSGDTNSIVIADSLVSYSHFKIVIKDGAFYLYDLISEHGTYLNGKKLLRYRELNDFDEIRAGRTIFLFRRANG